VGNWQVQSGLRAKAGFTLLELLLVLVIVAIASVGVTLAMRDSGQAQLETQALRLAALLEAGRAQSRASGAVVRWQATPNGFVIGGVEHTWTADGVVAQSDQPVLLGPEPMIAAQSIRIWRTEQPDHVLRVATDGVRPFAVQDAAP
jgi:general secretion pathway protein H